MYNFIFIRCNEIKIGLAGFEPAASWSRRKTRTYINPYHHISKTIRMKDIFIQEK